MGPLWVTAILVWSLARLAQRSWSEFLPAEEVPGLLWPYLTFFLGIKQHLHLRKGYISGDRSFKRKLVLLCTGPIGLSVLSLNFFPHLIWDNLCISFRVEPSIWHFFASYEYYNLGIFKKLITFFTSLILSSVF